MHATTAAAAADAAIGPQLMIDCEGLSACHAQLDSAAADGVFAGLLS
jgi:hypothetical protein